jgi:hypothetical protein
MGPAGFSAPHALEASVATVHCGRAYGSSDELFGTETMGEDAGVTPSRRDAR